MVYPFLTLDDGTEIVRFDDTLRFYIEKPDAEDCFHHAYCTLPGYVWEDVYGFSPQELSKYKECIMCALDYTEWQREHFDAMSDEEFTEKMIAYEKAHPYMGNGTRI